MFASHISCGTLTVLAGSAGERKYHATLPFVMATGALGAMAWLIDTDPVTAFAAMLCATVLWGPAGKAVLRNKTKIQTKT